MTLKERQELKEWHTGEVILWLQNEEWLYRGAKDIRTPARLAIFWRNNKPSGAKTNSKYVDWNEVFTTIKEEL